MTNPYGGTATHYAGYGTTATTSYGTTAYHASGAYYPPPAHAYYPYHPPTTVNYYGSSCGNCGGWSTAGAAAAGAMVGDGRRRGHRLGQHGRHHVERVQRRCRRRQRQHRGGHVERVSGRRRHGRASTTSAYQAGVAAGSAAATPAYAMGGIYPTLPAGCITPKMQGTTYYLCGNTWFQPSYGANGVSYRVVPTP